jgi:methionyl-tRNA formyltransferase
MRSIYFANNLLGLKVLQWLKVQGDEPVGLVVHPAERQRYGKEIIEASGLDDDCIFDASKLREPATIEAIKALEPDLGISVLFVYVLKPELISLFPKGCVNLHPALLPYNRGTYPNVWSIVEGTPAGVTLHYIDEGIDTGEVIAQQEVPVSPTDTGESLYHKLEDAAETLFVNNWPLVKSGQAPRAPQPEGGTFHRFRDVDQIDQIDLDRTYTGRELINILRARTFPPYDGAFFEEQGRRFYMRLQMIETESATVSTDKP